MASIRKRGKTYSVRYLDENGIRRERKAYPDRQASEALAKRLERQAARRREGLTDSFDDAARQPLADHLADYHATLEAGDHSAMYVSNAHTAVRMAIEGMRATYFGDITPSAMQRYLGTLAEKGRSPRTINNKLDAVRAFLNWAVADRRLPSNPLVGMAKRNVDADRRRVRRSLTVDELNRLIAVAKVGPTIDRVDGPTRAFAYALAGYAGLRRDEVGGLVLSDIDFDERILTVRANVAKNGKRADVPMCEPLLVELNDYLTSGRKSTAVGPMVPIAGRRTFEMVRVDAEAAGIPVETSIGRVDFHALRATFASNLARAGVPIQTARELMRHSTIQLTASVYTKLELRDMRGAVDRLGELATAASMVDRRAQAVGSESNFAPIWPTKLGSKGQSLADDDRPNRMRKRTQGAALSVVGDDGNTDGENRRKPLRSCPARTRT